MSNGYGTVTIPEQLRNRWVEELYTFFGSRGIAQMVVDSWWFQQRMSEAFHAGVDFGLEDQGVRVIPGTESDPDLRSYLEEL